MVIPRTLGAMFLLLLVLSVSLALTGCGSLTDEPRIVSTLPPRVVEAPTTTQALSGGARLFAERCTPCHGAGGHGDGPLVLAGQIAAPPDFTQPATMSVQGVEAILEVVTDGRIEKMMPPWEGALTDAERMAVAQYVAGLGGTANVASTATEAGTEGGQE